MINTKRIFTALLLAVIAMASYAYDFEVDGIYYSYDVYGNAVVTHGDKKYTGKIKIPSEVKWNGKKKKVVEIGDYAFYNCPNLNEFYMGAKNESAITFGESWLPKNIEKTVVNIAPEEQYGKIRADADKQNKILIAEAEKEGGEK